MYDLNVFSIEEPRNEINKMRGLVHLKKFRYSSSYAALFIFTLSICWVGNKYNNISSNPYLRLFSTTLTTFLRRIHIFSPEISSRSIERNKWSACFERSLLIIFIPSFMILYCSYIYIIIDDRYPPLAFYNI